MLFAELVENLFEVASVIHQNYKYLFRAKTVFFDWIGSHCGEFVFGIALFYAPAFS
jgi:hypothetical protein